MKRFDLGANRGPESDISGAFGAKFGALGAASERA